MIKVFIDGSAGTTGLRIKDRLSGRDDISLITLPEDLRKDINARRDALNSADAVFLCLPDDAAKESVSLIENPAVKVIDTSTAHRTDGAWAYGFPELKGAREKIKNSRRIANPGCHASGFISLIAPLTENGIISKNEKLTCFSLTGYTGGGKKMIADYESTTDALYFAPRQYGLGQSHKHLPEMSKVCALKYSPCFCPVVGNFPCGMEITVPLFGESVKGGINAVKECPKEYYNSGVVRYSGADENGFLSASAYAGTDEMCVSVFGNDERIILVSRFDNLGKGASGAAIQNFNIITGNEETKGLIMRESK